MRRFALGIAGLIITAGMAVADEAERLFAAMRLAETVEIMRAEGMLHGDILAGEMLPDGAGAGWPQAVSRIYDTEKMRQRVEQELRSELDGADVAAMADFLETSVGAQSVTLELAAREAFLDDVVESNARDGFGMGDPADPLVEDVQELIDAGDLVNFNVMGALNANLMFYRGLVDGGAYEMADDEILSEVWAQEEETRVDSAEWIGGYLMTAYSPMSADARDALIEFYASDEGRAFNAALFAGFDRMYGDISYLLGLAVAAQLQSQKL